MSSLTELTSAEREALQRAETLARNGRGDVEPNPIVGAVVLSAADGHSEHTVEVLGEGWHERFGGPHAEVNALAAAGGRARGGTMCVTLEPCSTAGKTAACTEALLAAGIARLVVGCVDPAPGHSGHGLDVLRQAGVSVVLANSPESRELIAPFVAGLELRRPHVFAKWALSAEGALAPADRSRRQLTGRQAQALVHDWRAALDGVLVGVGTVLADDPLLTARGSLQPTRPLRRIVLDRSLRTPPGCALLTSSGEVPTWLMATDAVESQALELIEEEGARVFRVPGGPAYGTDWTEAVLECLWLQGVKRLMVEGGAQTLERFFQAGLVDQVAVFLSRTVLGPGALAALESWELPGLGQCQPGSAEQRAVVGEISEKLRLQYVRTLPCGDDVLLRGVVG